MTLVNEKVHEIERGSTRLNSVENLFRKRLWTCRKTGYMIVMNLITFANFGVFAEVIAFRDSDVSR